MSKELKVGDVFVLKSGSVEMTVASIKKEKDYTSVLCLYWRENHEDFGCEWFPLEALDAL